MIRAARGVAIAVIVAGGLFAPRLYAQDEARTLPTLLIKGEAVSLEADVPEGTLMKVRDRYGFETPIFVTGQTKFSKGGEDVLKDQLQTGASVEVEYNFDINTAKRYAVVVKLPSADAPAGTSESSSAAEVLPPAIEVMPEAAVSAETEEASAEESPAP